MLYVVEAALHLEDAGLYADGHVMAGERRPRAVLGSFAYIGFERLRRDSRGYVQRRDADIAVDPRKNGPDGLDLDPVG